jgi:hypothetical protein
VASADKASSTPAPGKMGSRCHGRRGRVKCVATSPRLQTSPRRVAPYDSQRDVGPRTHGVINLDAHEVNAAVATQPPKAEIRSKELHEQGMVSVVCQGRLSVVRSTATGPKEVSGRS